MPKIEIDTSWAKSVMKNSPVKSENSENRKYEWGSVQGEGAFKFRLLPPNLKSHGRFGMIVGKHYGLGKEGKDSCTCVEATYPEVEGLVCPVCEALRRMKRDGIEEAKKYDVTVYNYVKAVMLETPDNKDYKRDKITILRGKGNTNLSWILNKYLDADTSDFMSPDNGAAIKFYRKNKSDKWERSILDTSAPGGGKLNEDPEIQKRLLEENEEICLDEIFKFPDDQEMIKIKDLATELENSLREASNVINEDANDMVNASTSNSEEQGIEFRSSEEVNNTSTVGTVVPQTQDSEEITKKIQAMKPHTADSCFGNDKEYDVNSTKCLKCPYSFECASCIKEVRGVNVEFA